MVYYYTTERFIYIFIYYFKMEIKELKILGLTNGEIKVFSAVLNAGTSSINNIHEKTGIERRGIYDIINKLVEKGLISYTIEKGKRTYHCAPPNRLKEKTLKIKEELEKFEKLIPVIENIYKSSKPKINIEVFRGKEGIKTVFEDILNYEKTLFIGGRWYVVKELPFFWRYYNKRRIKKGVVWYNLVLHDAPKIPTKELIHVKVLPKEFNGSPAIIWIYGNKVVNVLWGKEFFAFMIESKQIAENYRRYHRYLWDNVAKKL